MTARTRLGRGLLTITGVAIALGVLVVQPAAAQQSVTIDLPSSVSFNVEDIGSTSEGSSTTINFSDATLDTGKVLRVWVKADAANFTPPSSGGGSIGAPKVSWNIAAAHNGIGYNGTLSSASYTLVFQSDANQPSGFVDLDWSLAAPAAAPRAGNHSLPVRWKLEAVTP